MRTCAVCNTRTPDETERCPKCGADLAVDSAAARSLTKLRANPRVRDIRLMVRADACPACQAAAGTYLKQATPALPIAGCSCPNGCEAFYEPALSEIYP